MKHKKKFQFQGMSNRFINTYIIPLDFFSLSLYQHNFDMTRMEITDSFFIYVSDTF